MNHASPILDSILVAEIKPDYSIGPATRPMPALPAGGALVRLKGCGLCGSDLEKILHQKALPGTVLGHEVVGVVEVLADQHHSPFSVGDRIVTAHHTPCGVCHYCRFGSESMCRSFKTSNLDPGGFSQRIALTQAHLQKTALQVPQHITDEAASCVEPLACTLRAIDRLAPLPDSSVLVIGLGFIGLMAVQRLKQLGCQVIGTDISLQRLHLASSHRWLDHAVHAPDETALSHCLSQQTPLGKVDAVFLSVVNEATLAQAFAHVRDGGQILLFSSAATPLSPITSINTPLLTIDPSTLYFREINIITSYSPSTAHLSHAADLIYNGTIEVAPLISHRLPLRDIAQAIELYRQGKAIKVFLTP